MSIANSLVKTAAMEGVPLSHGVRAAFLLAAESESWVGISEPQLTVLCLLGASPDFFERSFHCKMGLKLTCLVPCHPQLSCSAYSRLSGEVTSSLSRKSTGPETARGPGLLTHFAQVILPVRESILLCRRSSTYSGVTS